MFKSRPFHQWRNSKITDLEKRLSQIRTEKERLEELLNETSRQLRLETGEREKAQWEKERLSRELRATSKRAMTLRGFIPICACCKKIRDDKGYWNEVEAYLEEHSEIEFSHGLCPECQKRMYPDFFNED